MSFLSDLFGSTARQQPTAPAKHTVPLRLPRLNVATGEETAARAHPSLAAQLVLKPQQTAEEYLFALEQNHLSEDAIKALAYALPERECTWYACQSARRVADKLPAADQLALAAAEAWVRDPNPQTQARADAAAAKTEFRTPAAWAARAAAWALSTPGRSAPDAPPPNAGSLTPHAAAGSVLLAAAMENDAMNPSSEIEETPQGSEPHAPGPTPAARAKIAKLHQPYIDLGKDIAMGKNTWA